MHQVSENPELPTVKAVVRIKKILVFVPHFKRYECCQIANAQKSDKYYSQISKGQCAGTDRQADGQGAFVKCDRIAQFLLQIKFFR